MRISGEKEPKLSQSLVVDEDLMVLWGNGRYESIGPENLNWETVEVHQKFGLTPKEKMGLAILDNKSVSTEWDDTILARELPLLSEEGIEHGFNEKEIKTILAKVSVPDLSDEEPVFELTPRLYEKYNYIMLFFDNDIDFLYATQLLELKKMADRMKPQKVGLYRAIPGMDAINLIKKNRDMEQSDPE